jgi:hypothetical protein
LGGISLGEDTMETAEVQKLVDDTFEDIARVLEGIFAVHVVEDEVIWQVMKHLGMCHDTALAKLEGLGDKSASRPRRAPGTHPAVEALLLQLKMRRSPEDPRGNEEP